MSGWAFADPGYAALAWLVVALLALLVWSQRRASALLERLVSSRLVERLAVRPAAGRRRLYLFAVTAAASFLVLALMRPQWGFHFIETPRAGAEIMVALDVSRSMLAEDVAPNRLERAKAELRDLLGYLGGDRVGLIAFAGRATVLSPLTPDFGFLRLVLDSAGPSSVTRGGTSLEEPIRKAVAGFAAPGDVSRSLLLITDGEDHDSFVIEAAKEAAARGVKIIAIGIGDESGSEIRVTDPRSGARTVLRDADGNAVLSRLDGDTLREIARLTGGAYVPAGTGVLDLEAIYKSHIAPLTRGSFDGRGRAVRNEAYQWPLLAALVCIVVAAFAPGRAALFALCLFVVPAGPAGAQSQEEHPRDAYNRSLTALQAGELDRAAEGLQQARESAAVDGELRYRSVYNLGWVEVRKADAAMQSEPKAALEALQRAADWFRRAVELRPKADEPRKNLEIVLHRALVLADALAPKDDKDLRAAVEALIEAERNTTAAVSALLVADDTDALRAALRELSVQQSDIDAQAEAAVEKAATEIEAIQALDESERTPAQLARAVQLGGALHFLHRAREKIGQARGAMRRLETERAFRRTHAVVEEFKRARDQLLDPVAMLDSLIGDAMVTARASSLRGAADAGIEDAEAPQWLSYEFLSDSQQALNVRVEQLAQGFHSVLEQAASAHESGEPTAPEAVSLLTALAEAAPSLDQAQRAFTDAARELESKRAAAATVEQVRGLASLGDARERFLDFRGLVEVLDAEQQRIAAMLEGDRDAAAEYVSQAAELQRRNLERVLRTRRALTAAERKLEEAADPQASAEQAAAERERLQAAAPLLDNVDQALRSAGAGLAEARETVESGRGEIGWESLQAEQSEAREATAELRRLFFSVLDHLKEIARKQLDLGDRSGELASLAAHGFKADHEMRAGRLAPEQEVLAQRSELVASALAQHAEAVKEAPADAQAQAGAPTAEAFEEASVLVTAASADMRRSHNGLTISPPVFAEVLENQRVAVENLARAIALLEPPKPEDQEQQDGDDSEQQQQQGGEQQEAEQDQADPGRQLQGVRDREAQRRAERERAERRRYDPVEKDW